MAISLRETSDGPKLRIAIAGATGLIGTALARQLREDGHSVQRLIRRAERLEHDDIPWSPREGTLDPARLEGVDAIVNLSGAPLDRRWTSEYKGAIRSSRVDTTALIARTVASLTRKPSVFVNGSAIGIYGDRGDEELDESSGPGNDFLATLVRDWESATDAASSAGVRVVLARSGLVLSPEGGALARMLTPARLGLGGRLGSGRQWMSWISLRDEVRALRFAIHTAALRGAVNLVAPNPVPNAEFAKTLGRVLGRPAIAPVPAFALELVFGEMARETVLASQRVHPRALLGAGFAFEDPTLERALRHIQGLGHRAKGLGAD
jgi:uncharacterized protein (TIGR01777 family)